ncbi:MAG TPA: hypothetical protein VFH02_09965 [Jiangellaceae bacterium]|nr:hypothetical protein [Jiangellaceae bacterium]
MGPRRTLLLAVTCLALTACGDEPAGTAGDPTAEAGGRYTTTATIIEAPHHGPQLCTSVMESYPPQCGLGSIEVVGWDWTVVDGSDAEGGTTWGTYVVIGTYDGERFTITESPMPYVAPEPTPEPPPATTPCPPPADGWGVVDAATTTEEAHNDAVAYAHAQPDYVEVWVDSSMNPAWAMKESEITADTLWMFNDPTKLILNVRFTGDLERHERALRAIWGGWLCVSSDERTAAELESLRARLHDEHVPLGSSVDGRAGQVFLQVIVDDGLQAELDQRYGPGLVRVHALLKPVN